MTPAIAVVGQACLLPGARTPDELWLALLEGRDLLSETPEGRWGIDRARVLAHHVGPERDASLNDRGGYVAGFEGVFDPGGFALPAETLRGLDPLFLWTLHTAREALRDAGLEGGPRVGLVLGNLSFPSSSLSRLAESVWLQGAAGPPPDPRNRFLSGLPAHLAARALGLGGGAFALDAACASSFYALKLACDRLHDRSADVMLAGAVNRADDLFIHVGFSALKALSPSGRSRPFHRQADGLVPAEGAAFVVLRRLDDAVAAGERVLGVIRGIGLSNDGRGAGLLAPAEEGQRRALAAAYRAAGLRPSDVSLLECHATGTAVGDLTELRSTGAVFAGCSGVPIGSVKSNLGHLVTVAGMAGLLKVLLAIRHGVRPPTLHADEPLPELAASPFRLIERAETWDAGPPRRAGLSAFGFGGNNAHVVVEEWRGEPQGRSAVAAGAAPAGPLAVIGIGAVAGDAAELPAVARALFGGESRVRPAPFGREAGFAGTLELDAAFVRFPPRDLEETLPQQLLLLRALREALPAGGLPFERTAVLVGMQCDAEVARYGARWRLAEWATAALRGRLAGPGALEAAREAFAPALSPAGVLGTMPNLCANRLNSQLDARGPSFTVSAEELSGVVALELAARALRAGEIDAAVVGAVDVCSNEVHARAAEAVLGPGARVPGDAAIVLVVKRLADAERAGERPLALLPDPEAAAPAAEPAGTPVFGHPHAASGLLQVLVEILSLRHRARPGEPGRPSEPRLDGRTGLGRTLLLRALGGETRRVALASAGPAQPLAPVAPPVLRLFAAEERRGLADALRAGRQSLAGAARLALVAASEPEADERARRAAAALEAGAAPQQEGLFFGEGAAPGELALVFGAPAGSTRGMGRGLALALPRLVDSLAERWRSLPEVAGWVYDGRGEEPLPEQKLWGSSFLCQLHAELTLGLLGLRPEAAIGFCSGETNALFALGAWGDLDAMVREIAEARIYSHELAGSFDAVRRFRGLPAGSRVRWNSHRVLAPLDRLREALAGEPLAHLAIVNAPGDAVVAGDADACERVLARIGSERARPLGYDIAVHCPELAAFAAEWRRIHLRPTRPVPGVRFYTHAGCDHYQPTAESAADALTAQALGTVDFPRLVEKAWRDGVRVFLEHGPQGACSRWIGRILGERPHLALSLDEAGADPLRQAAEAVARLWAAGVRLEARAFADGLERVRPGAAAAAARPLRFEVARATPRLPDPAPLPMEPAPALPSVLPPPRRPAPAPAQPPALGAPAPGPAPAAAVPTRPVRGPLAAIVAEQARMADVHRRFVQQQAEAHRRFLALPWPASAAAAPGLLARAAAPAPAAAAPTPPAALSRAFSRRDLEVHASGRISEIFGPLFVRQDGYPRQVRMPEPPLLLADRVTGLRGEPGSMGTGTVWTETDVGEDAFYLHAGRMPAGVMIEAGQADLFLISWLGADFTNRGERVYRLLGCELTYSGGLPRPGETLRYEIHVDGHARQGDVRLFFFHYDCRSGGDVRLRVREGQAGFFSDEELAASGGVLWDAADEPPPPARCDPPRVLPAARRFDAAAVEAFSQGRVARCFGPSHAAADAHVETPRVAAGEMLLLGEVQELDAEGGPWRRGYLRARRRLDPRDWFYAGHFKNDPCMPGTLMFEGCLQAMAFYMAALGCTLDKDGWRFEPVPDVPYRLRCRGQAVPESRELVYELFVSELHDGPEPTLFADLLCTVDGVKAFHCRRMGLRLVPDTPLSRRPERRQGPPARGAATRNGLRLDYEALLACAWGPPSRALGPRYARFDAGRRMPRLPGPPYHFLSRVTRLEGEIGALGPGAEIDVEYDIPDQAWYIAENGDATLPFCVLLEAALQPCGYLALGTGIPLETDQGLHFRNLDGTGTLLRAPGPDAGTLTSRVRLLDVSRSGGMALVSFEVRCLLGDTPVFEIGTGFGFFPAEALAKQVGLPTSDAERAWLAREGTRAVDLAALLASAAAPLPGPRLLMLDRVSGCWPDAGARGLGRWRAEKDVRPSEWFFKAHFFQDPVQPGSLGLQALLQLVQCAMLERGMAAGLTRPRFEALAPGRALSWKYRGQVVPRNERVTLEIELTEVGEDARGRHAVADGWLWVDGVRIYSARGLAVRLVDGASRRP